MHGSSRNGPGPPETGRRAVDERGVTGRKIIEAEADARERTGPEVLDHDVGVVDQGERKLPVRLLLEVEGDRPLALVQGQVCRTEPGHGGSDGEDELVRRLDLDHVCAEPAEERGRERADSAHSEIDDSNAGQRSLRVTGTRRLDAVRAPRLEAPGEARDQRLAELEGAAPADGRGTRSADWKTTEEPP